MEFLLLQPAGVLAILVFALELCQIDIDQPVGVYSVEVTHVGHFIGFEHLTVLVKGAQLGPKQEVCQMDWYNGVFEHAVRARRYALEECLWVVAFNHLVNKFDDWTVGWIGFYLW